MTPTRSERFRLNIVLFSLAAVFMALGGRLYYLQVLCHEEYEAAAEAQTTMSIDLPAPRGEIFDSFGRPMALSVPVYTVAVSLPDVADPSATARKLAPLIGEREDPLAAKLERDRKFIFLKRRVPVQNARAIEEAQREERKFKGPQPLAGIVLVPEFRRAYVCGPSACHALGFTNIDDKGQEGIERAMDGALRGTAGKWELRRDGRSRGIGIADESYQEPVPGAQVWLTLDLEIQRMLDEQVEGLAAKYSPAGIVSVIMDPQTGRVLAMSSWPGYDPNKPGACEPGARLNRVTASVYEPGSAFKPFVAAAGIQEGIVKPQDRFFCENGAWRSGKRTITDAHPYGALSLIDIIAKSSNIGMAKVGERIGPEIMHRYSDAFGFGRPAGIGLPGECGGVLRPPKYWNRESVHSVSFGHEVSVTPLQLAAGYAALANGGTLYRPQIVLRVENARDGSVRDYPPQPAGPPVVSPQTSAALRGMLRQVVERGTGKLADVEGCLIAGKTGTARKLVDGHYSDARHYSTFVGFAPADRPRVLALITVDEPKGACYGGTVSAPAVGTLLKQSLAHLGVGPRPSSRVASSDAGR